LESPANKVKSRAQNIESSDSSHVRSLSDRIERLSRSMGGGDGASQVWSLTQ
jgi:hypothetical protein